MKILLLLLVFVFSAKTFALTESASKYKEEAISLYNLGLKTDAGKYFLPAAKENDPSSQYYYAVSIISRDRGLSNEAIGWLEKSANNGNLRAMFRLTGYKLCSYKKSCPPSGKSWFEYAKIEARKRADKGDGKAMYLLAIGYLDNGQKDRYYKWMEKSAEAGYSRGQYGWAKSIRSGQGFYFTESGRKKDVASWAQKSFENGFPPAGLMYAFLIEDKSRRNKTLEKSAREGYVKSISYIAYCYFNVNDFEDCPNKKNNRPKAFSIMRYLKDVDGVNTDSAYKYGIIDISEKDKKESRKYDKWVRKTFKYPSYFEYIE